jgi:hypothetical protein
MTRDDLTLLIELYLYEVGITDPDRRTKLAQEIVTSIQEKIHVQPSDQ